MDPREMMVQQVPMMNDIAAQQGMNPEQLAGPQGDILEQLSSGMLGQQGGAEVSPMSAMGAGLQQNTGQ
jgi:hypothetical protein